MKVTSTFLAALFLLIGCQADMSPSPGLGDPYPAPMNDPRITVVSPDLQPWLGFHPATVEDDGERPLQVNVPVRNLTNRQYLIDYRFLFYDEGGMEISPAMGWKRVALEPKQTVRLRGGALSTEAADYRLEVRWAR